MFKTPMGKEAGGTWRAVQRQPSASVFAFVCISACLMMRCAEGQLRSPDPERIEYPDYPIPYALNRAQAAVTGVWDFVGCDGNVATGTWLHDDSVDEMRCTREWSKYASEVGSNGFLVVYWDRSRSQKRHVAVYRQGRQNGLVAWFWRDGTPRRIGQMTDGSWVLFSYWYQHGRLGEILCREDPVFVVMGWHSNGVPRYLQLPGKELRWSEDGKAVDETGAPMADGSKKN